MKAVLTNPKENELKQFRCGENILLIESHFLGEAKLLDLLREHLRCRLGKAKRAPANQFCGAGEKEGCQ